MNNSITDIEGIKVGHLTNEVSCTGCTVVFSENGFVCGVDVRGGAPGTRETDILNPTCLVKKVHAILITGGSALGLAAADGVVRYLMEQGSGFDMGVKKIPIVPAAVIFDLHVGNPPDVWPSAEDGYQACLNASFDDTQTGSVGVGMGANVGKVCGIQNAMRGGLGCASTKFENGLIVGVLVVVNAFGDVMDYETNEIIAGARSKNGGFLNTMDYLMDGNKLLSSNCDNTSIGVVGTNADFDKVQVTRIAQMAQVGLSQVIYPSQTMFDGDTVFAFSKGEIRADHNFVGIVAAELMKRAVASAIKNAKSIDNIISFSDLAQGNSNINQSSLS